MDKQTTIIEVNGIKLEVDLRTAKRVDQLRVGDRVKVLNKAYDGYEVLPGTVVCFEPFEKLPTTSVTPTTTTSPVVSGTPSPVPTTTILPTPTPTTSLTGTRR